MKGMHAFLSRGFACLVVALVILGVLAMPTQGVRANDPSSDGPGAVQGPDCAINGPEEFCPTFPCVYGNVYAGYDCNEICRCQSGAQVDEWAFRDTKKSAPLIYEREKSSYQMAQKFGLLFRAYPDDLIQSAKMAENWTFSHHIWGYPIGSQ